MPKFARTMVLKLQTTKDGELEEFTFAAGDEVTLIHTWDAFYLIKDAEGHFYNVPKDCLSHV